MVLRVIYGTIVSRFELQYERRPSIRTVILILIGFVGQTLARVVQQSNVSLYKKRFPHYSATAHVTAHVTACPSPDSNPICIPTNIDGIYWADVGTHAVCRSEHDICIDIESSSYKNLMVLLVLTLKKHQSKFTTFDSSRNLCHWTV